MNRFGGIGRNRRAAHISVHLPCGRPLEAAANTVADDHAVLTGKSRKASPYWMRHTHTSRTFAGGAELTTLRDHLQHASIYPHSDNVKRARQPDAAFAENDRWHVVTTSA